MIDKEILKDIGFEKGTGWEHEVWVYNGDFWVHYDGEFSGLKGQQISGSASNGEFFEMFIENIERQIMERARVSF